jgi:O-antigen/teichoic acid export membrane protein
MMWQKLVKDNVAYAIGSAANGAALFILLPVLVQRLSPEEYGIWSLVEIITILLNMIMVGGLDLGVMRYYWFAQTEEERATIVGTALIGVIIWSSILSLVVTTIILPNLPGDWLPVESQYLLWILAICWLESILLILLNMFRIREQPYIFVILSLGKMLVFIGLATGLVYAGWGIIGAILGRVIGAMFALGIAIVFSRRFIVLKVNWQNLRQIISYGFPLLPTNLAMYILLAFDRYALEYFSTLQAIAIYGFAYKLATSLDFIVNRPFALDWAPRRFKIATTEQAAQQYSKILTFYLYVVISFVLLVLAMIPTIYQLLAPVVYQTGQRVVPILLLAYIIYGLSYPLNIGIMLKDKTQYMPIIAWIAAVVCIALNLLWIPRFKFLGAAWATVFAYTVWTGGIAWISLKLYHVPYRLDEILWLVLMGGVGYIGIHTIHLDNSTYSVLIRICFVMIVMLIMGFKVKQSISLSQDTHIAQQ